MKQPVALIILDGFGFSSESQYNAITHAQKPFLDYLFDHYPHTFLRASGTAVGLPDNHIGHSEVGHLTIGAGRAITQSLTLMNKAIDDGSLCRHPILLSQLAKLKESNGSLHIIGLLSDAGLHGHENHLYAFLQIAKQQGIKSTFIHPILDGRDAPPQSAATYLTHLEKIQEELNYGAIGSLHGRFYAMDRNKHWDRTQKSYDVLTQVTSIQATSWQEALANSYAQQISDEFLLPIQLNELATVHPGDGIIFCNIRDERASQLTAAFVDPHFDHFPIKSLPLSFFITPVPYQNLTTAALYMRPVVKETLFDLLAAHHKTIFSIAETEKYAHVTYFFRGQELNPVATEVNVLIPSHSVTTYAQDPAMSAQAITERVCTSLQNDPADFYLINYANADMVGHSGNFEATVQAIEYLDAQIGKLYKEMVEMNNGILLITADHGKAEQMYDNKADQPHTAHTPNPVPFLYINKQDQHKELLLKELADIAPFILQLMHLPVPKVMKR